MRLMVSPNNTIRYRIVSDETRRVEDSGISGGAAGESAEPGGEGRSRAEGGRFDEAEGKEGCGDEDRSEGGDDGPMREGASGGGAGEGGKGAKGDEEEESVDEVGAVGKLAEDAGEGSREDTPEGVTGGDEGEGEGEKGEAREAGANGRESEDRGDGGDDEERTSGVGGEGGEGGPTGEERGDDATGEGKGFFCGIGQVEGVDSGNEGHKQGSKRRRPAEEKGE